MIEFKQVYCGNLVLTELWLAGVFMSVVTGLKDDPRVQSLLTYALGIAMVPLREDYSEDLIDTLITIKRLHASSEDDPDDDLRLTTP